MDYELISEEEFDKLPQENEQCFVEFEAICRKNMTKMLENENSEYFYKAVRQQYMTSVYTVAEECRIPNIPIPDFRNEEKFHSEYSAFALAVQGEVARVRVRGRRSRNSLSVQLEGNTRTKIEHYVSRLREVVNASDLSPDRKKALGGRLDDLLSELGSRRLNLGKAMLALSLVLSGLGAATQVAADGPAAVANIMKLIGFDKESEEEALSRLAPPPKALPAPDEGKPVPSKAGWERPSRQVADLDDDIPF